MSRCWSIWEISSHAYIFPHQTAFYAPAQPRFTGSRKRPMNRHHYPVGSLKGDYLRAGIGLLVTAGPQSSGLGLVAGAIFGGLAALFLGFGLRTPPRQRTVVFVAPEGIATEQIGRAHARTTVTNAPPGWRILDAK